MLFPFPSALRLSQLLLGVVVSPVRLLAFPQKAARRVRASRIHTHKRDVTEVRIGSSAVQWVGVRQTHGPLQCCRRPETRLAHLLGTRLALRL
jgi:hypothetical protein